MRDPTGDPSDGEHHGEHVQRDSQGSQHDPGVEIDVGVQTTLDEVVVGQNGLLQLLGDVEQWVLTIHPLQQRSNHLAQHPSPRVPVAVHPMTETSNAHLAILGSRHVLRRGEARFLDGLQLTNCVDVGPTVPIAPQGTHPRRGRGEQIGTRGTNGPHRRRRTVLAVVGMQDEEQVEGTCRDGIGFVELVR